jgi:CRP-like cAMP-binding protein
MNSTSPLIAHIQKSVRLTEDEVTFITAAFTLKKIKKKQIIIQPGFPAPHRNYVVKGAFRAYVIGENGDEHTIQLAIEDWWISDYNAYINRQPATMFVVALEDSTILQIAYDGMEQLKNASNAFKTFLLIRGERTAAFQQRRLIASLTQSAEQRYNDFILQYSLLAQRIPQYVLASYLGMSTEFLSRIRNKKRKKKS